MSLSMQGSGRECWENSQRMDMRDPFSREHPAQRKFALPGYYQSHRLRNGQSSEIFSSFVQHPSNETLNAYRIGASVPRA